MQTECYANPQCLPPSTAPTETSSTTQVANNPNNGAALPVTGGDVGVMVLIALLLIIIGVMWVHMSKMGGKFRG